MSNPEGFRPNADGGAGARYGRCPKTNRAFKADGTVRKARTTKTPEQRAIEAIENERKAHADIGRKLMASIAPTFVEHYQTYRKWESEAKAYATPEAREARKAALQRQIDAIDAKGEAAEVWMGVQGATATQAAGIFASFGKAWSEAFAEFNSVPTEDECKAMLAENIDAEAMAAVEAAADPANDPFADFRRGANAEDEDEDDSL